MNSYIEKLDNLLQVLDMLEDAAIVTNDAFEIVALNREASKLIGESPDEIIGKKCYSVLFDKEEPCPQCLIHRSLNTGEVNAAERYLEKWDKHFIVKTTLLINGENDTRYYLETFRDARQIREYQQQKEEREQKFKSLFHHAATGIVILNKSGEIVEANPQAGIILGYPPRDLIQVHYLEFLFTEDENAFDIIFKNLLDHKVEKQQHESRLIHRSGNLIWVKLYFSRFVQQKDEFVIAQLINITYEKKMESILVESETRFRSLYENAPLAYQSLDESGYLKDINPRWLKTLGYERSEVIGKHFTAFLHPDYVARFNQSFPQFKSSGFLHEVVFCMKCKDGSYIDVAFEGCVGYTPEGKFKQTFSVFKDITNEIASEKKLNAYQHRLERAEGIAAFGHWLFDLNTREVNASIGARKIYGVEPGEAFTVAEVQQFPLKKYRPMLDQALQDLIVNHKPYEVEFQIRQKDTGKKVDIYSVAEYDAVKNQVFGVIQDVTSIHEARRQLQESTFFARSVLDSLQEGIIVYDRDFKYTLWNKKMEQITGRKANDILGRRSLDLFPHLKAQGLDKLLQRALQGEIITSHDILYQNENTDEKFWYFAVYSPYFGIDNRIKGVVAVISDITERKNAEDGLKASNEALRKANAELDNFVYRVSHDLRAPITSSLGLAKLIQMEQNPDGINQYAKLQEESLLKLDKFIHDILDYSRNSRLEVQHSKIDFDNIIEDVVRENKKNPVLQQVRIIYSKNEMREFLSDPLRVKIILNNIISNAFKYHRQFMHKPFIKILVEVSTNEAAIIIEDNGMGIASEHQNKIFQMFYRATDKKPGTGIGLYIVKDCLEKLDGSIEVDSNLDEGTRFIIRIPQG